MLKPGDPIRARQWNQLVAFAKRAYYMHGDKVRRRYWFPLRRASVEAWSVNRCQLDAVNEFASAFATPGPGSGNPTMQHFVGEPCELTIERGSESSSSSSGGSNVGVEVGEFGSILDDTYTGFVQLSTTRQNRIWASKALDAAYIGLALESIEPFTFGDVATYERTNLVLTEKLDKRAYNACNETITAGTWVKILPSDRVGLVIMPACTDPSSGGVIEPPSSGGGGGEEPSSGGGGPIELSFPRITEMDHGSTSGCAVTLVKNIVADLGDLTVIRHEIHWEDGCFRITETETTFDYCCGSSSSGSGSEPSVSGSSSTSETCNTCCVYSFGNPNGVYWDIDSWSYDCETGDWTIVATSVNNSAFFSNGVVSNCGANAAITSSPGSGTYSIGTQITVSGTSTPPCDYEDCRPTCSPPQRWSFQFTTLAQPFLSAGFQAYDCEEEAPVVSTRVCCCDPYEPPASGSGSGGPIGPGV